MACPVHDHEALWAISLREVAGHGWPATIRLALLKCSIPCAASTTTTHKDAKKRNSRKPSVTRRSNAPFEQNDLSQNDRLFQSTSQVYGGVSHSKGTAIKKKKTKRVSNHCSTGMLSWLREQVVPQDIERRSGTYHRHNWHVDGTKIARNTITTLLCSYRRLWISPVIWTASGQRLTPCVTKTLDFASVEQREVCLVESYFQRIKDNIRNSSTIRSNHRWIIRTAISFFFENWMSRKGSRKRYFI